MSQPNAASAASYDGFDRQFIAGEWRHGGAHTRSPDHDPYTGEMLVEIPEANSDNLDQAFRAAKAAQPAWEAALPGERAAVLRRVAAIMDARREEIIGWLIRESGSTRLKASLEWTAVRAVVEHAATLPYVALGQILPADVPGKEGRVYRRPVGVVAVISPWNWPLQLTARSLFPALALGNAVVVKPASDTPISGGLLLAKILEEAGLPAGLLSVLVGAGSSIGKNIVTHPVPRVVSFTGSTPVGRGIARQAAEAAIIKRVELELGGNSPLIVLADADLDLAAEAAVFGKFLHQGQICMITNRVIVEDAVHDAFVDRFVERVRALKVGDPNDPDTFIGPIINGGQFEGLLSKIEGARAAGARLVLGCGAQGLVLPPHVFVDVRNDMDLAREEIFGPIAPILRARNADDAIRIANDTPYGLSAALFTADLERGVQLAGRIEAGMVHINDQPVNDLPNHPFGGEKNSGIGRFNGDWAVAAFTTDRWVTLQRRPRPYAWDARQLLDPGTSG